jgi:DNA invertase Pin-like site-specific DNA recombinase
MTAAAAARRKGGKIVGYKRVSSMDQNEARQLDGLELDKEFTDKASGQSRNSRPQLEAALDYLREGDVLKVHSMDRLARNMSDLQALVKQLTDKGVMVEFVKENLTFTGDDSPMNNLLLGILGSIAQFERALIKERQREGIALAKKAGVYKGRKRSLTSEQLQQLRSQVAAGLTSKSELARQFGISRKTLYQYLTPTTSKTEAN